jgi:hypothetical protein
MSNPHIIGVIRRQNPPSAIGIPLIQENLHRKNDDKHKECLQMSAMSSNVRKIQKILKCPKMSEKDNQLP